MAPVPISPRRRLPFQKGPARIKFWFGKDKIWYGKIIYATKFTRAEHIFWGTRAIFIQALPKIFCSVSGALVQSVLAIASGAACLSPGSNSSS